jgi:protein-disulfide isomerase
MTAGATETTARDARLLAAVQMFAALALAFSSASAVEYYGHGHAFCAAGSGCGAVRESQIGRTIGEALPAVGVIGFLLLLACTGSRRPRIQLLGIAFAVSAGLVGLCLLAAQVFVVGAWCTLCVGADVPAVAGAACALPLLRARLPITLGPRVSALGRASIVLALFAPPVLAYSRPTPVPAFVGSLSVRNKINVIEFSDFECPFCRRLHPVLMSALAPYGDRVHFVRRSFPLPSHRHARDAARAYHCAAAQGEGEALADRLFAATDLSPRECARQAVALGVDAKRFDDCVRDPATDAAIDRDIAAIRASGFHGLPTVWIDRHVIEGFDSQTGAAPYTAALARAGRPAPLSRTILPWALLTLATLAALLPGRRRA